MKIEKQIQAWLDSDLITEIQAKKMLADVHETGDENRSNNLIVTISIIGSVLLSIGAIMFVASNWQEMSNPVRTSILIISTLGAYYLGYLFKYEKKNLPKVGGTLFFLASLLFGASIFLIAQIYNINANNHSLLLMWMIGIIPLIYGFRSIPITTLVSTLFFVWIGFFLFRENRFSSNIYYFFPIIYLTSGTLLFALGGLNYFHEKLRRVGRMFRIFGIEIAMASLFLLTFQGISGHVKKYERLDTTLFESVSSQLSNGLLLFAILSIIALVINLFFNPAKSKTNTFENISALAILGLNLLLFFFPATSNIYTIIFNLIFAGLSISLIFLGNQKTDIKLVNMGIFWISVFIFARYFDAFWDLMPRSIFFMIGGLILVLGGIAMERKRRQLKENFIKLNA